MRDTGPHDWLGSARLASVAGIALAAPLVVAGCTAAPSPIGTWGPGGEGEPQLTISEEGAIGGTDGCNIFTGSWSAAGEGIVFSDVVGTLMACENVDTWLSKLNSATIHGDEIHILDRSGTEIGTLTRQ